MAATGLTSCFTGVEGTNKINLSRQDKKKLAPSPEDTFLADVKGLPLARWEPGKEFIAAADRTALIFVQENLDVNPESLGIGGKTLLYKGWETATAPDGTLKVIIDFDLDGKILKFDTSRPVEQASAEVVSSDIPMMIDVAMIQKADSLMKGKSLWTRSSLWYNKEGHRTDGAKYVPVTIDSVIPGSLVFPAEVIFHDATGNVASMFMNLDNTASDSRSFPNIFSLSDPRTRYPSVTDEVWTLIQHGRVRPGMTKEECRLSLGNPSDVASGHDWSQTLDIWRYDNGNYVFLRFEDGVLIDLRR